MRLLFYVITIMVALAFPAMASVDIFVDKSKQQMTVSVDNHLRYQWKVSTGMKGYETPSGKFHANRMEKEHFSKEFQEAYMPYSIFFTEKGHAIHGSLERKTLGQAVSHGCIRLSVNNAALLYDLVENEGLENTYVTITDRVEPVYPVFNPFWFLIPPQQQKYNERKYYAPNRGAYR